MTLREKYEGVIRMAEGFRMRGSAEERGNKLYLKGIVQSQEQADKIWEAIKAHKGWQYDVIAEIRTMRLVLDFKKPLQPLSTPPTGLGRRKHRNWYQRLRRHF
jgi:hypothetical protein